MNKNMPVSNKFLNRLWQDFDKNLHRQRLREIASNNEALAQTSERMPHLTQNCKKYVNLDQKYTEIERENHILLK